MIDSGAECPWDHCLLEYYLAWTPPVCPVPIIEEDPPALTTAAAFFLTLWLLSLLLSVGAVIWCALRGARTTTNYEQITLPSGVIISIPRQISRAT
jgi:hypothetical protein